MSIELTHQEREAFRLSILSAYPEVNTLTRILDERLDIQLNLIARGESYENVVFNLIKDTSSQGTTSELLEVLYRNNRGNNELSRFYNSITGKNQGDVILEEGQYICPYIERQPIERVCCNEILNPSALLRIKCPMSMGKTWLLEKQILPYARSQGYQTITIDLAVFDADYLTNNEIFLKSFCSNLGHKLDSENKLDQFWDRDTTPNINATHYLEEYLFRDNRISSLVLALDNVDTVFEVDNIRNNFCRLLRAWHDESNRNNPSSEIWKKVRLVIVHATDIYGKLDINSSPLGGVGKVISLREFTLDEVKLWIQQVGLTWDDVNLTELYSLVGGHPLLLKEALQEFQGENITMDALLNQKRVPNILNHVLKIKKCLQKNSNLANGFRRLIDSQSCTEIASEHSFKLEALGLVNRRVDSSGEYARVTNNFYREYFRNHLDS